MDIRATSPTRSRDRFGCQQCKARRRKCGRERPQCHACVKRGQHCDYNVRLLWQEEVVAPESGSVIVGGARRTERQTYFTSTTVDDIELFCDEYNGCNAVIDYLGLTPVKRGSSSPFTASLTSYRPRDNAFFEENVTLLLEYYQTVVCYRRVLVDSDDNPFRQILLPVSHTSQILRACIIAFAANDIRNRIQLPNTEQHELSLLTYKTKALSLLRNYWLNHRSHSSTVDERDGLLLSIFILCYLDIADGTKFEWSIHMQGCVTVIKHFGQIYGIAAFSAATLSFVYHSLILPYITHETTQPRSAAQDTQDLVTTISQDFPALLDQEDAARIVEFNGLSSELLDIIRTIDKLSRRRSPKSAETNIVLAHISSEDALSLHHRLQSLQQHSSYQVDPNHRISLTAEAYKQAACIFMHHALFGLTEKAEVIRHTHLPHLLDLLEHLHRDEGQDTGSMPYPLWALFIGAAFANEDQRPRILELFASLMQNRPKSNVPLTQSAVEAVWKKKDLNSNRGTTPTILASPEWQDVLRRLGWRLALV